MKFYDTLFEDYIASNLKSNLHPKLTKIYKTFPSDLSNLKNLIFYGPKGVGKYTQMLTAIKRYSPSELKYEKKMITVTSKSTHILKISDIHYEVDMSLLGCNSRALWNELFNHIVDAITAKPDRTGIIVCKYFHEIHSELLEHFYSYMQTTNSQLDIKFVILTEELSFIPDNIINRCKLIRVPRPSRSQYNRCLSNKITKDIKLDELTNMKNINASVRQLMRPYERVCENILELMLDVEKLKFMELRDKLYDIFIYNLDITDCIWYILEKIISLKLLSESQISLSIDRIYQFLYLYNNNYRPIYHLESFIFYLITQIHGFTTGM